MATDGVWDVMENDEAVQMATNGTPKEAAAEIVAECARRWDKQMPEPPRRHHLPRRRWTHPDLPHYSSRRRPVSARTPARASQ